MGKSIPESSLEWLPKKIWGNIKWKELHSRGLAYLPMDKEEEWFNHFKESIPCPYCQRHFRLIIEEHPPVFTSRPEFFKWTVMIHNEVNKSLGKKEMTLQEALMVHSDAILYA